MANKGWFQKGHPAYYTGKKLDMDVFIDAYNRFARRELSKTKFANEVGVTRTTLNKHLSTLWTTGELRGIFKDTDDVMTLAPMA